MKLAHLKIGIRLGLGFGLVLVLMIALALIGASRMAHMEASLEGIVNDNNVQIKAIMEMRHSVMAIGQASRNMALLRDADDIAEEAERIADDRDEYSANVETLQARVDSEAGQALLAQIAGARAAAEPVTDKVLELVRAGQHADATALLVSQGMATQRAWIARLDQMVRVQERRADRAVEVAADNYRTGLAWTLAIAAIALLIAAVTAWGVSRSITGPLAEAVSLARRVAQGDLSGSVVVKSGDETGQLMQALKEMHDSLVQIVEEVRGSTKAIARASTGIAAGNQDLSARTEQQASSLEETASSMEQLMATVRQNASNAMQADSMARTASEVATKGGAVVGEVVHTMSSIEASAHRIVDIIAVINDIAFQTNILALNAAVEAARAGEQGRGFAVVATEVRALAQRSAAAAKEIKVLIEDSVRQVDAGTRLVGQAGSTMQEIVTSVRRVNDIMDDITSASDEQTRGIEQINQAVTQMDAVTQQNAALVEQAAAASESLQEQAATLERAVNVFRLEAVADEQPPAPPQRLAANQPAPVAASATIERRSLAAAGAEPDWQTF